MGRSKALSIEICIMANEEEIPYMKVDKDGKVTWLVSDKEQQRYEQIMLKNISQGMSRLYSSRLNS